MVYAGLGIAFISVSLWVFLSKGRSAKALRAKYRLGGAMLSVWAMLSAASCGDPSVTVMCYDPVVPEGERVAVMEKDDDGNEGVRPGDVLVVHIEDPSCPSYRYAITSGKVELQAGQLDLETLFKGMLSAEVVLGDTGFKGEAVISIIGVAKDGTEILVKSFPLNLI